MKNLRLAIRSLLHFRLYTAINLLGLGLCLMCVIVIFRYVHSEMTVDHFNKDLDRIFVSVQERDNSVGQVRFSGVWNPNREEAFVDLREDPAVERWSNYISLDDDEIVVGDERKMTVDILAADTNFLQILDFPVIAGTGDLSRPDNVLITEEFARKFFGESDPLGEKLKYSSTGKELTVVGVIGKTRTKSSLEFDLLLPMSHSKQWTRTNHTLVLLYTGLDHKTFNEKYADFFEMGVWRYSIRYQLFPLKEVYLDKTVVNYDLFQQGNRDSVLALAIVGLLILLVGVFNFINIYTAVVLRRGREFGMKKVFGAPAFKIFGQLLLENVLMIGGAIFLALALTEVLNPVVKNLLGFDQLPFRAFDFLLAGGLLVGLPMLTTVFPFFHYNYAAPVNSLRSVGKTGGRSVGRRVFLLFQYVLTIGMIVISLVFVKQLRFMLNADLGFRTEDIIEVPFLKRASDYSRTTVETVRDEGRKVGEIAQRMDASPLFTVWMMGTSPRKQGRTSNFSFGEGELKPVVMLSGNRTWFDIFGIELKAGRLYDDEKDSWDMYGLIVTESALPYFGITDIETEKLQPEQRMWLRSHTDMESNPPYEIIGVVNDLLTSHLSQPNLPSVILCEGGGRYEPVLAAIAPGKKAEAIEFLRQLHAEIAGGEFTYTFVEDEVAAMYRDDRRVATVYSIFTAIAILISALGLFSMSLFDIQQRFREIAIRKVNGATTGDVLGLLLKRYLWLLLGAFVVAAPVAGIIVHRYFEGFILRTRVSWWIYALALAVTAGISLLTLIWQTRKAARTNPATVIRNE